MSLPGTVDSRQPIKSVKAVASHINKGGTCQPTASPLKRAAADALDTHTNLLACMKTCAQVAKVAAQASPGSGLHAGQWPARLICCLFLVGGAWDLLAGAPADMTLDTLCCRKYTAACTGAYKARKSCLWRQDLWGRCAGRNKEDAATLVEGLNLLQLRQGAERNQAAALEAAQARVQQLEAQLAAARAQPAPARPALA